MHHDKLRRDNVRMLANLPNTGPSLAGNPPWAWWRYTPERKRRWPSL
ncbi:MAG: hypothetical protein KAZ58_01535 [Arenimonas sp.]|jgi:hypothetical protein|nr:hypothetical protein [Arenimonas sp.]